MPGVDAVGFAPADRVLVGLPVREVVIDESELDLAKTKGMEDWAVQEQLQHLRQDLAGQLQNLSHVPRGPTGQRAAPVGENLVALLHFLRKVAVFSRWCAGGYKVFYV